MCTVGPVKSQKKIFAYYTLLGPTPANPTKTIKTLLLYVVSFLSQSQWAVVRYVAGNICFCPLLKLFFILYNRKGPAGKVVAPENKKPSFLFQEEKQTSGSDLQIKLSITNTRQALGEASSLAPLYPEAQL